MKRKIIITILIILSILTFLVSQRFNIDNLFYENLMRIENSFITGYFKFITKFANATSIIILLILLIIIFRNKQIRKLTVLTLITHLINMMLKSFVGRSRPININKISETGYSFPSGHAMISTVFYGYIIYLVCQSNLNKIFKNIINLMLILLIINIAISRVYLGVHFVTDVVAGILISSSILLIFIDMENI